MKPLFWRMTAIGAAVAVISSLAMLCLFTVICLRMEDPSRSSGVLSRLALLFGAFLGGRVAASGSQSAALSGVTCGACYMLVVLMPSVIFSEWGATSLLWACLTVVFSLLGACVLRGRRYGKSSYRRRHEANKKYGSYV